MLAPIPSRQLESQFRAGRNPYRDSSRSDTALGSKPNQVIDTEKVS